MSRRDDYGYAEHIEQEKRARNIERDVHKSRRLWDAFLLHRASMCDVDAMDAAERSVDLFDSRVAVIAQGVEADTKHEPTPLEESPHLSPKKSPSDT